ncbi:MAG TPA: AbrB/MazE/SpoVT family DNA-binding domain-containing protein [Pseudobdellovibrionaceae bacterium]|jgi:AbrB family looped-hinge helix DNA binding protein
MKASKLTSKYQATVPKEVRAFLGLASGDGLQWEIEDGHVVVKKISKIDLEWQKSIEMTLSEWNSPEDDEAYGSL